MDRALAHGEGGFLHRLGQRRMRVAGAGDVFRGRTEFHRDRRFRDHVAGVGADNVHAEHAVGLGIGQDFHKALGGEIDLGAAVGGEGSRPRRRQARDSYVMFNAPGKSLSSS